MMTDEERGAYLRGLADAYAYVFKAFTTAFADGKDIHWLRAHIAAQWERECLAEIVRGVL
jgi:hypothetical protein